MPDRIIRAGIRSSDRTAANVRNGGWMAQVFYDWLLTVVDDYGRFDARPSILRAELFPLLLDLVREADVQRCLESLEAAGLVRLYIANGRSYLEIRDFRQRLRAARSRHPAPANDGHSPDNDTRMPTDTDTDTDTEAHSDTDTEPPKPPKRKPPPKIPEAIDTEAVRTEWEAFVAFRAAKGKPVSDIAAARLLAKLAGMGPEDALRSLGQSIENDWQGVFPPKDKHDRRDARSRKSAAERGEFPESINVPVLNAPSNGTGR